MPSKKSHCKDQLIFKEEMKQALKGNSKSQLYVGLAYFGGRGTNIDYGKAVYWLKRACNKGEVTAHAMLGSFYYCGIGVEEDYQTALHFLTKARNVGNGSAQYHLGKMRSKGHGVTMNLDKALLWYEKSAQKGYKNSYYEIGKIYDNENYNGFDKQKAITAFKLGAKAGCKYAQKRLGRTYETGDGVPNDFNKAEYCYMKSAEQGYTSAYGCLGWLYLERRNYEKAFHWLSKAAEADDYHGQRGLGSMYRRGLWVYKNNDQAIKWYTKSALQGSVLASEQLTYMYLERKDYKNAFYWCSQAIEGGEPTIQYNYGMFYFKGEVVTQNFEQASVWLLKAALQGHYDAQKNLGGMYINGWGVPRDLKQARFWFEQTGNGKLIEQQFMLGADFMPPNLDLKKQHEQNNTESNSTH